MNKQHTIFRPALLATLLTATVLAGCGQGQTEGGVAEAAVDPNLVVVNAEMARNFKVAPLAMQKVSTERDLPGRIEANEQLVTRIGASVTGRVTEVSAEVGARVRAGQQLARVSSPELTNAQLAYLRAHSSTNQAQRAVERAQQLIQADVIGSAELQRREAELSIARAELRAATDQLLLLGVSPDYIERLREKGQLSGYAGVNAPRSGVVIERKVSQGQVAQPGDPLFTIADLSKVWVVGALPEQDASAVQMGQRVEIRVPALPQRQFKGKVVFVSDTISPETRTLVVRTEVDNADRALKPQMLATLRIIGAARDQLAVPEAAVVRDNDKDHIYVQTATGQFRLTPVELAPASGGLRPLLKGPMAGTPIVVDGAFHLNNERKRAELE
ncbi:MAG: efflux RND transporter periplasmic adaptor subunit [Hylemonella sp.]|uniref:efflux RND transporter periplasmic adaptor subunit n=1 Tax=Hylemonella sp. TaxID=2066020 RepID=UPI00391DE22B